MKSLKLLFIGSVAQAGLICEHPKLTKIQNEIKSLKHKTDEFNFGSRYYADENNYLREYNRNFTIKLENLEAQIGDCQNMLKAAQEENKLCPKRVYNCYAKDCNNRVGYTVGFQGSSVRSRSSCHHQKCRDCPICDCPMCDDCDEPWMEELRISSDDLDEALCIIENYKILKLEKFEQDQKRIAAEQKHKDFENRNMFLVAERKLNSKHHDEYSAHYSKCAQYLMESENQLLECEAAERECKEKCSVPLKFLRMDKYRRLDFRQKKFDLQDLKSVISCPDWHLCPRCVNCQCARCPRCKF